MWLLWWMLRAVAFHKEYSFPIQRLGENASYVNAWHPWVALKGMNGFIIENIVIFWSGCSAVLPISFFITRFDMFNTYFIVQYQEGSKLPICIDTVHLKLCQQLLNQFWEL